MEIYHGSNTVIRQPRIIEGRFTKDFGAGFYCTLLKAQAQRWAQRYDNAIVDVYEYEESEGLKMLRFDEMTDQWLDFIVACRRGLRHDYDIVEGPMADDQIYNYVADFIDGVLTREQFWVMARFKYPTHQLAFCSQRGLATLTFKRFEEIER